MSGLTVYTDSLGGRPANTTLTVTNIRFTEGAGCDGLLDGDSTGLQTINGDPFALVADATSSAPVAPFRTIRSTLATASGRRPSTPPALQVPGG